MQRRAFVAFVLTIEGVKVRAKARFLAVLGELMAHKWILLFGSLFRSRPHHAKAFPLPVFGHRNHVNWDDLHTVSE